MARTSSIKVETRLVSLRSVQAVVPKKDEEKLQLVEDLTKMGCKGLLAEPWAMKSEAMVREFYASALKQMGGHYLAASGAMDSGPVGRSLQLPERRKEESGKNRQMGGR